jgi:hypothetical protein
MSSKFLIVAYKRQEQVLVRRVLDAMSGAESEDILNAGNF